MKLEHLYYKNDSLYAKISATGSKNGDQYVPTKDSKLVIEELVQIVNNLGTSKMKVKAALCQAYHHGLHKRFYEGREILLKTHIGESIHLQEISTQILYNRAVTQIGVAAFRLGLIEEAHETLVDIAQTHTEKDRQRLKEILAQGVSRIPDKPVELEKEELKR